MSAFNSVTRLLACISLIIGAVECFAGFKVMKAMMAVWGFFIGAIIGVVIGMAAKSIGFGVASAVILGCVSAILSFKLYLAGIFILTAFLTAVALYIVFENIFIALLFAVGVGTVAVFFVKPVVIATTSISGAGIILSSAYIIMNLGMNASPIVTVILWIPIALSGIAVQYITTQKTKGKKIKVLANSANSSATFSERKYPGMQRAYRNFCIKCGCELFGSTEKCPRCGYCFDD